MTKKGNILLVTVALGSFAAGWITNTLFKKKKSTSSTESHERKIDDSELVESLLAQDLKNRTFKFADVIFHSTERKVLAFDPKNENHQEIASMILKAATASMQKFNRDDSPIKKMRRINEASRYFEDFLLTEIDRSQNFRCEIPKNAKGVAQRAGYPDILITHIPSDTTIYLDPKLFERKSESSSLRTFYYEPKKTTHKIHHDAIHLILGIQHDGKDGDWTFEKAKLVDISSLNIKLKAEFQASNKDLYREIYQVK